MEKTDVLEVRSEEELDGAFVEAEAIVLKKYMAEIGRYEIKEADEKITRLDVNGVVRLNKINRLVYDMEENSRMECLVEFNEAYGQSLTEVRNCLDKFFTKMTMQDKQDFIFSFFPFMFGIYPYTVVSEKQREAMVQANVNYVYMSIYEITFSEVKRLLGA